MTDLIIRALSLAVTACGLGWGQLAWAVDEPVLPEVTVIGERVKEVQEKYPDLHPDHALNPYRVAPSSRLSVQTFSADEIASIRPVDVFDLLNHAVGVLSLYQGRKVPYSVRIRGDLYFAYIIDGVYIPSESAGRILQNLPVNLIEQMDVVRDATALTLAPMVDFGRPSGAPNDGYIVIRTRRPLHTDVSVTLRAERFDTDSQQLYAGMASNHFYVSGFGSHNETAGRSDTYMTKRSGSGMARLGYTGELLRAEFSYFNDRTRQQIQAADPMLSTLGPQRWQIDPVDTSFTALNMAMQWDGEHTTTLTWSEDRLDATMVAGTAISGIAPRIFPNEERIRNLDIKHTWRHQNTLIRLGGQRMRWSTPTGASYYEGYPRDELITGMFATLEQGLLDKALVLDAALRRDQQHVIQGVDHYYAYQMLFQQPNIANRTLPANRFATLGAAYQPNTAYKLTTRLYAAQQGATDQVPAVDNKTLHPESQAKAEIGLAHEGWAWLRPSLTIFSTRIHHAKYPALEVRDMNGRTTALWDETEVRRQGLELQIKGQTALLGGDLNYGAGWTWLTGHTTNEDYGRTSPKHTLTFTGKYTRGLWEGGAAITGVDTFWSDWKSVDGQFHPIGYFTRLDMSLTRRWVMADAMGHWALYGRNLLNQRYQTQLGYRDPGMIWGLELGVDY